MLLPLFGGAFLMRARMSPLPIRVRNGMIHVSGERSPLYLRPMTNFYVCQRKKMPVGSFDWHAGITDASTFKKRSSSYADCILWEDMGSRKNALRFEAMTETIVTAVFYEERLLDCINSEDEDVTAEERQSWIDDLNAGQWWANRFGGDTSPNVDALNLATIYQAMLSMYEQGTLVGRARSWHAVNHYGAHESANEIAWRKCVETLRALKTNLSETKSKAMSDMWEPELQAA